MPDELVDVGGDRVSQNAPFGARTTYRVGGTARYVVSLDSLTDLEELSEPIYRTGLPVIALGNGSNLLVADGQVACVVVVLGVGFTHLEWREERHAMRVRAGAALSLPVAARRLSDAGIIGFEWAVGVPGSFGGAAVMNAGGHGSDMAHSVRSVSTWNWAEHRGEDWSLGRLEYGYRSSALRAHHLVTGVTLQLRRGDVNRSRGTIREIVRWRRENQPGGANAGSVFQNPPEHFAGQLIEEAGLKGLRLGSAQVSDKHANFIQVDDNGSANDVYALMSLVREKVHEHSGIQLHSELRCVGFGEGAT